MFKKSHTEAQTKATESDLDSTDIDAILSKLNISTQKSEDASKSTDTNKDASQSAGSQTKDPKDAQIQDLTNSQAGQIH